MLLDMKGILSAMLLHLFHVDDHESGYSGGEDKEHGDDVDERIALHLPRVVILLFLLGPAAVPL